MLQIAGYGGSINIDMQNQDNNLAAGAEIVRLHTSFNSDIKRIHNEYTINKFNLFILDSVSDYLCFKNAVDSLYS